MPQITLAIPFHANLPYLKKTIESVLGQSLRDWALVVSDDSPASKPEISQKTETYVRSLNDPRITYFRNLNSTGMASNWNQCLELAKTDLVTILHADDELAPEYCAKVVEAAEKSSEPVAFFTASQVIDGQSRPKFSFPDRYKDYLLSGTGALLTVEGESGVERLLKGNIIFCPSLCFRKSRLGSERFQLDLKMVTDFEMILRLLLKGHTLVGLMGERLYRYRRHDSNATVLHTQTLLRFREEDALYRNILGEITARGWAESARLARGRKIIQLNLLFCMVLDLAHFQIKSCMTKFQFLLQVRKD